MYNFAYLVMSYYRAGRCSPVLGGALGLVLFVTSTYASFNAFQGYDPSIVINLNISSTCMAALNETVDCDQNTATMAARGVDYNYWYADNVTTLCTAACLSSLDQWQSSVEEACASDVIWQSNTLVQAKIVPLQYTYSYSLACLQDGSGDWCMLQSQEWQGSDYMRYHADFCWQDPVPDVCNEDGFSIADINATMEAVPNLYEKDLYCNECFLLNWRQRLLSPLLPVSNFTDYLIDQFEYMQSNCSTSLPYSTSASTLFLGMATATTATETATGTASTTVTPTCTGQVVAPVATPLSCNALSDLYNVSTGDLRVAADDYFCTLNTTTCLPPPCPTAVVTSYGQTCDGYAAMLSNATYNVTSSAFFGWNQNIQGSCDDLAIDQRVCIGPPGGFWATNGSAYAPTATTAYHTTATPATPTQSGSVADCGAYYSVVSGDTCNQICLVYGIAFALLQKLNTYLNADCTNLWLGYSVCVAEVVADPVSTDGLCGPSNNYATCNGTAFGSCCSTSGYCGDGEAYCSPGNCFSGACTGSTSGVTTNGTCGPSWGDLTCDNPSFGPCCSIYGHCGNGTDYCGAGNCYSGACATDNGGPSINGECGPLFAGNKTCTGTQFGSCCSNSGYCGNSTDYCGAGNCYSGACVEGSATSVN